MESLSAIGSFIKSIGSSTDPFVNDRAGRLWEHVLQPLVMQLKRGGELKSVEIVDIGSSTGSVVGKIAANLVDSTVDTTELRLRIILIDSAPSLLSREFSDPALRAQLDDVQQVTSDYREWVADVPSRQSRSYELRIAFACKVFDMASDFDIRTFGDGELPAPPSGLAWFDEESRRVTRALIIAPYESLLVSSQRFAVDEGHVFAQPSLSTYFGALNQMSVRESTVPSGLQLPVRVFDPSTLLTSSGESAIESVLRGYDFLVIEDADLRPADLLQHLQAGGSNEIAALDLTASMKVERQLCLSAVEESRPCAGP